MFTIVYYSPTGNTYYLAKKMGSLLKDHGVELLPLEFTNPNTLSSANHLIIMYPVHGFNAPRTVKRFCKNIPSKLFEKVSLIAVGCNTSWVNKAVSLDLRRLLSKKKYNIALDEVLAMPLTLVKRFPKELEDKLILESENRVIELCILFNEEKETQYNIKCKSRIMNFIGKLESPAARFFGLELHAKKGCTSCGICWNRCPEKNITPNKNKLPKFGFKCSMCLRCVYDCPERVIVPQISKFIPIKNGYKLKK